MDNSIYNDYFKTDTVHKYRRNAWQVDRLFDKTLQKGDLDKCSKILQGIRDAVRLSTRDHNLGKTTTLKRLHDKCFHDLKRYNRDQTYKKRREWQADYQKGLEKSKGT